MSKGKSNTTAKRIRAAALSAFLAASMASGTFAVPGAGIMTAYAADANGDGQAGQVQAVISSTRAQVFAAGKCGSHANWTLYRDGLLEVSGSGDMYSYEGEYGEDNPAPWRNLKISIRKVQIDDGITSVGDYAFFNCTDLTELSLPNTLKTIGNSAFEKCTGLKEAVLPDGVSTTGYSIFADCSSLKKAVIPGSVETIGGCAFIACNSLTDLTIEDGVKVIKDGAFERCGALKEVVLPDSVESIEYYGFSGCESLERIRLSDNLTEVGYGAVRKCPALKEIHLPANVDVIGGECMFADCTGLEKITIPDGTKKLASTTFCNCTSLKKVVLPDSLEEIEDYAFSDCSGLTTIHLPKGLKEIRDQAFAGTGIKKLIIPASVKKVGYSIYDSKSCSFGKMPALKSIRFEGGMPKMGKDVFADMGHKITIEYDGSFSSWSNLKRFRGTIKWKNLADSAVDQKSSSNSSQVSSKAPATPKKVKAVAKKGKVNLSWTKVSKAKKYRIYRAASKKGKYKLIKTVSKNTCTLSTKKLKKGKKYYYKVLAVNSAGKAGKKSSAAVATVKK